MSLIDDFLGKTADSAAARAREPNAGPWGDRIAEEKALARAVSGGKVEMREEKMRRVYIDGKPYGDPLPLRSQTP